METLKGFFTGCPKCGFSTVRKVKDHFECQMCHAEYIVIAPTKEDMEGDWLMKRAKKKEKLVRNAS